MKMTLQDLVMAHRYLYYVRAQPVISDKYYDDLERKALELAGADSPLRQPGSDLESSYSDDVRKLANYLAEIN